MAVIRRRVLADQEPSAWSIVGRAAAAGARITGQVLPGLPEAPAPQVIEPPRTKKAVRLALYRAHPDYGNRGRASRVAAELAAQAGLQAGTARSYLYAELDGRAS